MNIFNFFSKKNPDIEKAILEGATILDVRTHEECRRAGVPNAINIPLNDIPSNLNKLKKYQEPILVCCESGLRSAQAVQFLKMKGINTLDLGGRMNLQRYLN